MFACSGGEPHVLLSGVGVVMFVGLVALGYFFFVQSQNKWCQAHQRLDERRESERLWRDYLAE